MNRLTPCLATYTRLTSPSEGARRSAGAGSTRGSSTRGAWTSGPGGAHAPSAPLRTKLEKNRSRARARTEATLQHPTSRSNRCLRRSALAHPACKGGPAFSQPNPAGRGLFDKFESDGAPPSERDECRKNPPPGLRPLPPPEPSRPSSPLGSPKASCTWKKKILVAARTSRAKPLGRSR